MSDIAYTDDGIPYDPNQGYNPLYPQKRQEQQQQYSLPAEGPTIEQKMNAITVRIPKSEPAVEEIKKEPILKPVEHDPFIAEREGPKLIADKLFGLNGQERYQLWPERMVREAVTAPNKALTEGFVPGSADEIGAAQSIAGMAGMGSIPMAGKMSVGSIGGKMVQPEIKNVPTFYSALENAVANINNNKLQPNQWLATIQNAKGVKPEEMEWTGLKDWLAEKKGPVSKQEIQDFINSNKVELKEVVKSANNPYPYKTGDEWQNAVMAAERRGDFDEAQNITTAWERSEGVGGYDSTKYNKYQLPGGENYREMLLTLPENNNPSNWKIVDHPSGNGYAIKASNGQYGLNSNGIGEAKFNSIEQAQKAIKEDYAENQSYTSSHWDEPNVLAHVRMNDRMIDGKRSLHLEEIQSDWHQQGRDKGYKGDWKAKLIKEAPNNNVRSIYEVTDGRNEFRIFANNEQDAIQQVMSGTENQGVPNAPFKKTWYELALKRMLREAAEKGYDRLSWTPGEAQAARYDLSTHIKDLQVLKEKDGSYSLNYVPANAAEGTYMQALESKIPANELADYVGKEMAEKIAKQDERIKTYSGVDLKIGGEGMRGFYDQIIPKALEKIGKEHGVKVKQGEVVTHKGYPSQFQLIAKGGEHIRDFDTRQQAMEYAQEHGIYNSSRIRETKAIKPHKAPIHYIDIPQSLKDQALKKGFPLFSSSPVLVPVDHNPFADEEILKGNAT